VPGGYAEFAVVPAEGLVRLPKTLTWEQAAAVQLAFGTAWHMLMSRGELRAGETVLINAGGSGIGSAAIQVAKMAGACVITTASTDRKIELAIQNGADHGINYERHNFVQEVLRITAGQGVDLVFEHIGGIRFQQSLDCLVPDGRLVLCGAHAGEIARLDLIQVFRRQMRIIGSRGATVAEQKLVLTLAGSGDLKPIVYKTFPLAEASQAHRVMENREHFGKLILMT
jgi:NADPH:quinone reductase-like Zn-dependent oxidoreductase